MSRELKKRECGAHAGLSRIRTNEDKLAYLSPDAGEYLISALFSSSNWYCLRIGTYQFGYAGYRSGGMIRHWMDGWINGVHYFVMSKIR